MKAVVSTVWIMASFLKSIFAVASSINTILDLLRIALHIQRSCFSPAEKLLLLILADSPPLD
jgi:hypothetical protein